MTLKPLKRNVLVRMVTKTPPDGLVLPDSQAFSENEAVVTQVGPDVTEVSPGDIVILSATGGKEIRIDGRPHRVIDVKWLQAVLTP